MKRVAWVLLAVAIAAFVRVQPVELLNSSHCMRCHCKVPGACGMPCCGTPAPASPMLAAATTAEVSRAASRSFPQALQASALPFYAIWIESAEDSCALATSTVAVPAARVPLFKAHCSFLI